MHSQRLFSRRQEFPVLTPEIETETRQVFIDPAEALVDLRRYWRLIRKRRNVVIASISAALLVTVGHMASTLPSYTAETTIMLRPAVGEGSDTLANLVEMQTAVYTADQYYKTQSAILESPNIAVDVIRHLELARRPAFTDGGEADSGLTQLCRELVGYFSHLVSGTARSSDARDSPGKQVPPTDYDGIPATLVHRYMAMLKVTLVPDTNLLKISFTAHDPRLSAELATAHVDGYRRQQSEIRYRQSEEAQEFLRGKLVDIRDQLEKSEAALNDFRRRKGIIPGLISLDGKNTVVLNRLADLSKSLTNAQVERIGLEAQLKIIRARNYAALPAVAQDITIQTLRKELNDLNTQDAALSSQFKPDYPPLAKLLSQIHETQLQLNTQMGKVITEIQSSYAQAAEKENELQTEINRQRAETLNLNDSAAQYAILQREVDTNRELYNAVLTRMKDVAVTSGGEATDVSVIVPAEVPSKPGSPNPAREILLALIVGLSGGVGLAFAFDILDSTLKNPEEAESYLQIPSLGLVPDFTDGGGAESPMA